VKLSGHAAVFNEWTRIDSREGRFLESLARGVFKKSLADNGKNRVKVLLSHGHDPELGEKPLAALEELREDSRGLYYAAALLDGVPEIVVSGLRAGLYGASFRFSVVRENFVQRPDRSAYNPDGLPERTLQEVKLYELGPTPFGAYAGATAALRSVGDAIELRTAGREEVLPRGLTAGEEPVTIRRLRKNGGVRARELLRELDRGARVEITWGASGRHLGRVLERSSETHIRAVTPSRSRHWRLPDHRTEPATWRL
jgi:HK97 family phage prohead protease